MTTSEFIALLKANEFGGATGRPREVMFEVSDKIIDTNGIEVVGSGDGLFTELFLSLPDAEPETGEWINITNDESLDEEFKCSKCGFELFLWNRPTNYCPNCGIKMLKKK